MPRSVQTQPKLCFCKAANVWYLVLLVQLVHLPPRGYYFVLNYITAEKLPLQKQI